MTACQTCSHPGSCCDGWILGINQPNRLVVTVAQAGEFVDLPPLVPEEIADLAINGATLAMWRCRCGHLTDDGRCEIYRFRPRACATYRPGSEIHCVDHPGNPWFDVRGHVREARA